MEWIINQLRVHPELAIFLTLFAGFWLGRLKIGKFSLGQSPAFFWSEYWSDN